MSSSSLPAASPEEVARQGRLAAEIGLWRSEEGLVRRWFRPTDALLNVDSGAGRVSLGLWELGYERVLGIERDRGLVAEARRLAARLDYATPFRVADVVRLALPAETYDGVLWLEGGLARREAPAQEAALKALRRGVRAGGRLVLGTPVADDAASLPDQLASAGWTVEVRLRRDAEDGEAADVKAAYPDCWFWVAVAT